MNDAADLLATLDETVRSLGGDGVDVGAADAVLGDPLARAAQALRLALARWYQCGRLQVGPGSVVPLGPRRLAEAVRG